MKPSEISGTSIVCGIILMLSKLLYIGLLPELFFASGVVLTIYGIGAEFKDLKILKIVAKILAIIYIICFLVGFIMGLMSRYA